MLPVNTAFPRPKHNSSSPIGLDLVFCGFWMPSHSSVLAGWGWAHVCAVNPNHLYKTSALTSTLSSVTPTTFCHISLLDPPLIELKSQSPHDGDPVSGLTSCAIFPTSRRIISLPLGIDANRVLLCIFIILWASHLTMWILWSRDAQTSPHISITGELESESCVSDLLLVSCTAPGREGLSMQTQGNPLPSALGSCSCLVQSYFLRQKVC